MLYHCGLLSERPERDPTLAWAKRGGWDLPGCPASIEHDRRVWLSMPGFSTSFHAHTLGPCRETIQRFHMADFAELRDDVVTNWMSATREDCVRLSQMRPGTGNIPLISQLQIMDDLKKGAKPKLLAGEYRITAATVRNLKRGHPKFARGLPSGFELLVTQVLPTHRP